MFLRDFFYWHIKLLLDYLKMFQKLKLKQTFKIKVYSDSE